MESSWTWKEGGVNAIEAAMVRVYNRAEGMETRRVGLYTCTQDPHLIPPRLPHFLEMRSTQNPHLIPPSLPHFLEMRSTWGLFWAM